MPEHDNQAARAGAAAHACSCAAHAITRACPVDCLRAILPGKAFHPLARAYSAPFDPPATVGDVVDLYLQRRLSDIYSLGPHRIGEIEASLAVAGLIAADSHDDRQEPAPAQPGRPLPARDAGTQ